MSWDVFISHAFEDKAEVGQPLASMLERRGLKVWFDEHELKAGQSLRVQIETGLSGSSAGTVILSEAFFKAEGWTQYELDILIDRRNYRHKPLIPVWHQLSKSRVSEFCPGVAALYALRTQDGLQKIADEIVNLIRPPAPIDDPDFRKRQRLANDFVTGLRQDDWTGPAFDTDIGRDTMEQIRSVLTADDTNFLLKLLHDETQRPGIRSRAASLLFGPRLKGHPDEYKRVATVARAFYRARVATDAWQVPSNVALALADQVNDGKAINDWISRLREDPGLMEADLAETDRYYHGNRQAVNIYITRIRNKFRNRPAGRLWEVFYLGRRAVAGDEDVIAVLRECSATQHSALRLLCEESLELLRPKRPATL